MRADNVVSNTSPILNLALIERLDLLESQFQEVVVPQQVWEELPVDEKSLDLIEAGEVPLFTYGPADDANRERPGNPPWRAATEEATN